MKTRAFTRTPVAQAISLILGSTVLVPALAQEAKQFANEEAANLDEIVVTGIRSVSRIVDAPQARCAGRRRWHRRRGHRQIPGHQPRRIVATHHRRVDRSVDRRRFEDHRPRHRARLQPRVAQRPADAGRRASATRSPRTRVRSTSRISRPKPSRAVEVYKTSRASTSTGGIGASVNIRTTRPLDAPGMKLNFGVKGVMRHFGRQPAVATSRAIPSRRRSPASSARRSRTIRCGLALTASYQERAAGFNQAVGRQRLASVRRGAGATWGTIPRPAADSEHRQPSERRRHLFGAAEPRLRLQRHRAQAHQWPG